MRLPLRPSAAAVLGAACVSVVLAAQRQPAVVVTGERREWHKVTLTLDGPAADEAAASPDNPFTDFRMDVTFVHASGSPKYVVPGYFAADGRAADTSATAGNKWRAHFTPDKTGRWRWQISFMHAAAVATATVPRGDRLAPFDGVSGEIDIGPTDKAAPDLRAAGRLDYVGARYLRFAGNGEYFLKAGSDSPETLLAFGDFDQTVRGKSILHAYGPHVSDWKPGDPSWQNGRGKGLIGAINYLSSQGANSISFLTYNAGGDGDNVWPFTARDDKRHYDVSKLDQWQIVFDHAQSKGLYLHFKLQETEIDDNVRGNPAQQAQAAGRAAGPPSPAGVNSAAPIPQPDAGQARGRAAQASPVVEALDGGALGPERRLYLRELIARFGYELALNWNLGEENSQTTAEQRAMATYIRELDPYDHPVVVHTFPDAQDWVYLPLLGQPNIVTGASLQNAYDAVHERTLRWVRASEAAGAPWVVANDEQNSPNYGVPPDLGYRGFTGRDPQGNPAPAVGDIRRYTLWGNLMSGGAGVEYYAGYSLPENDLAMEDYRSREQSWRYAAIAVRFFRTEHIPFWQMENEDRLIGNAVHDNRAYCFAKSGALYLVYLPGGASIDLDLRDVTGAYSVSWFNPRLGGPLGRGSVRTVAGGKVISLGAPPADPREDWLAVVRRL